LLCNPHIARNEEVQMLTHKGKDNMRRYYFEHLSDVIMVSSETLTAEQLGGADFDGDMIKTISDPIVNQCVKAHPELLRKSVRENCDKLRWGFDRAWENKLRQLQVPISSPATKGQRLLRFDNVLATALELGPLRQQKAIFSPQLQEKIATATQGSPTEVLEALIAYCAANRPEDADWVVLPVSSFDAYFGNTTFGRKYL